MTNNLDDNKNITEIRKTIAAGSTLNTKQLQQIRSAAISSDAVISEAAMAIMKLDPWLTKISKLDAVWIEKLYDNTSNTLVKAYSLRLLCLFLSEGERQQDRILSCLLNAAELDVQDWDLLIVACSCAGFVLSQSHNHEISKALASVMRSTLPVTNRSARDAILNATGMTSRDILRLEQEKGNTELWSRAELAAEKLLKLPN